MPGSAEARVVLLDEALFQEHVRPKIQPGYAATLAEYQAKNPGITHGLFMGKRLVKLGRKVENISGRNATGAGA